MNCFRLLVILHAHRCRSLTINFIIMPKRITLVSRTIVCDNQFNHIGIIFFYLFKECKIFSSISFSMDLFISIWSYIIRFIQSIYMLILNSFLLIRIKPFFVQVSYIIHSNIQYYLLILLSLFLIYELD